jgi:hypothetical protein
MWVRTTPPTTDTITITPAEAVDGVRTALFGNVCLAGGGGHTLGFWSNKNGKKLIDNEFVTENLAVLSDLNLVDAAGNAFDPGSYAQFRTWILGATATNMAYMLSAQLAAMQLNVMNGFVDGNALVFDGVGFISVNDLILAADAALLADNTTLAGDPNRATQEALKDALDDANNNLNFVQSTPAACTPYTF